MRLVPRVATAATTWPVTIDDLRGGENGKFLTVEHEEDDAEITLFLNTACEWLQPPFGILRVSIAPQTLRLSLPCWNTQPMELPCGPVSSIASIKYFDPSNVEQTLDSSNYFLDDDVLLWSENFAEPALYNRPSAVKISYVAGFADAAATPSTIKTAIMQCVAHWHVNREAVQAVGPMNLMPLGVDDLIFNYRAR